MENLISQRVRLVLLKKHISVNALAKAIGMPQVTVNNYLLARRRMSLELIERLVRLYPDVNKDWLLTGEGKMFNDNLTPIGPRKAEEVDENTHGVRFIGTGEGMRIEVPLVPYAALGSPLDEFAELLQDNGYERVSFPVDAKHHGKYFAFRVEGDSMDDGTRDGFQPGDIVLVRELDRSDWMPKLHISRWKYWVICWGNCVRLKQIVSQAEDGSAITCHSLNPSPEFTDFTLQLDDVTRLFNVVRVQPKQRVY